MSAIVKARDCLPLPEALAAEMESLRGRLECTAFRITHNRADAAEVVCEVFRCFALRHGQFDRARCALFTYLYRAVVNRSLNVLRSRERHPCVDLDSVPESALACDGPAEQFRVAELGRLLAAAQAVLSPRERDCLHLVAEMGFSPDEAADVLRLERHQVYHALAGAKEKLRAVLCGPGFARRVADWGVEVQKKPGSGV